MTDTEEPARCGNYYARHRVYCSELQGHAGDHMLTDSFNHVIHRWRTAPEPEPAPGLSEHGGLEPELAARITAAKAALGDYRRQEAEFVSGGPRPDWLSWAGQLAAHLHLILERIGQ